MNLHVLSRFINASTIMIVVALASGLLAAWAAKQHISNKLALLESQARQPEVSRVVAAFNLPAGTRIDESHLAVRSFPAGAVTSDSLSPDQYMQLEGMVLRSPLLAGDLVLPVHAQAVSQDSFSSRLLNGRRAITMPVDAINSASGLLEPGDFIDLYVSFEYQRRRITAPLLQGVEVMATGMATDSLDTIGSEYEPSHYSGYSTVTLNVDPEDAVKLVAARQSGTITSVLRSPDDSTPSTKASRGDLATLLGVNNPASVSQSRRASVLYGNTAVRSVPRLAPSEPNSRQPGGVFDLPYKPIMASVLRDSSISAQSETESNLSPDENIVYGYAE